MRVLVTGITGQVGRALLNGLRDSVTVIACDRSVMDLTRPQSIAAVLDRLQPDLIVNPAAYTAVDRAEDDVDIAMRVNADAPGAMANWSAEHDVPFLHFSTDYVFDGTGSRPWREDDRPRPLSAYGASKLAGEDKIRGCGGCFLIMRTSWIYAAQGTNFLCTIGRLARERRQLRIVADQIGAPTSAELIAKAVAAILAGGPDYVHGCCARAHGAVNFAASGETSWHGFATAIVEGLRLRGMPLIAEEIVPISTRDYPTRAVRPLNSRLDLSRWQDIFSTTPDPWPSALMPELDKYVREMPLVGDVS